MNDHPARQRILTVATYVLATVAGMALAVWMMDYLVVHYEMWSTGASSLEELGDDLGLGILWGMALGPALVIGAALGIGAARRAVRLYRRRRGVQPPSREHAA